MIRRRIAERPNWREKIESLGLTFNFIPAENCPVTPYWTDDAYYEFSLECVDQIRAASKSLHDASIEAVQQMCRHDELLKFMNVPEEAWTIVRSSFYDQDREALFLYGRFDLCVDPSLKNKPKMYEYNADTPTILLESSVIQADWLLDQFSSQGTTNGDRLPVQYNNLHFLLVERWKKIADTLHKRGQPNTVHFSCIEDHEEDYKTTEYIASTAVEAGLEPVFVFVEDVGWNDAPEAGYFVDVEKRKIDNWFKLYPWEFLIAEDFAEHCGKAPCCHH